MDPITISAIAGIAMGLIQGGLAGQSAKKNNKLVKEAANVNQQNIDRQITENRLAYYDSSEIAGQQQAQAVGTANVAVGIDSGYSITQAIASNVASGTYDQAVRMFNSKNQEDALALQKANIVAQAKMGIIAPGLAAASGFIGGAQEGLNIGSALGNLQGQGVRNDALRGQSKQLGSQKTASQRQYNSAYSAWQNQRGSSVLGVSTGLKNALGTPLNTGPLGARVNPPASPSVKPNYGTPAKFGGAL